MSRRQLNRRNAAALIGAAISLPSIVRAAPQRARPKIRLQRGMNLWPWFSLTREFPAPQTTYDWPPYQPDRAIPTRDDLTALHEAGIDVVRMPLDPGPLLAFSGERRATLIDAVMRAVEMALGVLQAFTSAGLRVPDDIAIIGYDDIDFAAGAAVPLSSVRQPREELGRTAAELLFDELRDPHGHRHRQVVFQPELVVRESSRLQADRSRR